MQGDEDGLCVVDAANQRILTRTATAQPLSAEDLRARYDSIASLHIVKGIKSKTKDTLSAKDSMQRVAAWEIVRA